MPRQTAVVRVLLLVAVAFMLLLGYLQRGPLLQAGINYFLDGTPLTLVDLQELRVGRSGLQLQQVDLLLPASGQTLVIRDLAFGWRNAGLLAVPQPESLRIGSARLGEAGVRASEAVVAVPAAEPADLAGLLQLLRDFPLASIELGALELPGRASPVRGSVTASTGNFAAELRSADLSATLVLAQPDATAAAQLRMAVQIDDLVSGRLAFTMTPAEASGQLAGSGTFDATGRWQGEAFAVNGTLDLPPCTLVRSAQCALRFDITEATLAAWTSGSGGEDVMRLQGLALSGNGTLGLDAQTLQWQLGDAAFDGTLAALDLGEYHLASGFSLREVDLAPGTSAAALSGSLQFMTTGLTLETPQPWLPAVDLDGTVMLAGPQLDFATALRFRDGTVASDLRVQGRHDLASAAGSASLVLAPLQLAEGSTLGQRLGQWPYTWDLVLGSLDAGLQLQWEEVPATAGTAATTQLAGTVSASLAGVAGYYDSSLFHGLATTVTGEIDTAQPLLFGTPPLELRLAELDVGLPLQDLVLRLQLDAAGNSLLVESLSGTLLGGSITMQQQRFDFGATDNALSLQFSGLRLEQVLALTGYEDIAVDGGISGEVPLRFSANGIEVAGGRLSAQQPGGNIRYLGTLGQGDASLALVRQALSNYRFDTLESSIDYSPDGELLLSMQLQGFNPELENGRRVNLNLNLSDNVPALLQSLQAGRAIEDMLQELYE